MIYNCAYCNVERQEGDDHTCTQCRVSKNTNFTNYTQYVNGTFYCLQFRYSKYIKNKVVIRIGHMPLINLNNNLSLEPEQFKDFTQSNKIKTYLIFS